MSGRHLLLTILILLPVSPLLAQGQRIIGTLVHDGIERDYILYVPSQYDPSDPMPLVLNFHGGTVPAAEWEEALGMNQVAEENGFLVAYPNAVNFDWQESDDHNVSFVGALLDTLESDYSVDSRRIYATGGSQGGIMSFTVAVALSDRFAAAAPLAGTRIVSGVENRTPTFVRNTPDRPFPLFYLHGSADTVVPYFGGPTSLSRADVFPSVAEVLDEWGQLQRRHIARTCHLDSGLRCQRRTLHMAVRVHRLRQLHDGRRRRDRRRGDTRARQRLGAPGATVVGRQGKCRNLELL